MSATVDANAVAARVQQLPGLIHDLRQPTCAVLLLAEAAELEDDVAALRRRLRQIRSEAVWLNHLIEASCDGDELRMLDLREVITDCVDRVDVVSGARIQADDVTATHVVAPPVGLRRALTNVVANAARAAGPCGRVFVRVDARDDVVVHVIDDGPGFGYLPVEHGAGLCIARAALASFGARLEVGCDPGGGSRVSLVLTQRSDISQASRE
jgi:signal transduction histidine kinase